MLNEDELKKFIGKRISKHRKKKGLSQHELGEKVGVKNNTISAYERGVVAPNSDTLFALGNALDARVDDFFPLFQYDQPYLDQLKEVSPNNLEVDELHFLQSLIEKALSLNGEEREKFLSGIKFTVDYYENNKLN